MGIMFIASLHNEKIGCRLDFISSFYNVKMSFMLLKAQITPKAFDQVVYLTEPVGHQSPPFLLAS